MVQQTLPFIVRTAQWKDLKEMANVKVQSFRNDPYSRLINSTIDEEALVAGTPAYGYHSKRTLAGLKGLVCRPSSIVEVAVYDGRVIGFAIWLVKLGSEEPDVLQHRLRKLSMMEWIHRQKARLTTYLVSFVPEKVREWFRRDEEKILDPVREESYNRALNAGGYVMGKHVPGDDRKAGYWYLGTLATLPEHQGKGVGSALLRRGCARAKDDDRPIYLKSSAAGRRAYEKAGFKVLEEWELRGDRLYGKEAVMRFEPRRIVP